MSELVVCHHRAIKFMLEKLSWSSWRACRPDLGPRQRAECQARPVPQARGGGGGVRACKAAPAPLSNLPSPLGPQSSRHTVAAGLVRCRAQRGGLGPTFTDHSLSLSAQSLKLPGPLLCRQGPAAPALCPAGTALPWVVRNEGGGDAGPAVSARLSIHLSSRRAGRGLGTPGHRACARVALPPSGSEDRGLQWGV